MTEQQAWILDNLATAFEKASTELLYAVVDKKPQSEILRCEDNFLISLTKLNEKVYEVFPEQIQKP